ncbi:MAG: AzlD domain-containing protein [Trueperaceae bacterium]|nr:AzlD domain-containing protein [Trueperaceae bacterium]
MTGAGGWGLILAMAAITFALRASFIVLQDRIRVPALVRRGLAYVPAAVLGAIVAPAFVQLGGDADVVTQAPRWAAGLVGAAVAVRTQNMVAVLVAGMLTLWGVQALLG